ncbi:MAG: hypothetical protein EXR52_00495 [Dehalococcoidia bacterium]|nr:hypothetical protein [Dehalococcoidia bacterium]
MTPKVNRIVMGLAAPAVEATEMRNIDGRITWQLDMPLFWLPVEAVVDAKIVSEWVFLGSLTGSWSHVQNIKAAR